MLCHVQRGPGVAMVAASKSLFPHMTWLIYIVSAGAEMWSYVDLPLLLSEVMFYMQAVTPSRSDYATQVIIFKDFSKKEKC